VQRNQTDPDAGKTSFFFSFSDWALYRAEIIEIALRLEDVCLQWFRPFDSEVLYFLAASLVFRHFQPHSHSCSSLMSPGIFSDNGPSLKPLSLT